MKSGNKYLVFGGTGVIGRALIKELKSFNGYVVNVSLKNENPDADENILLDLSENTDILDMISLERQLGHEFEEVFYLASYSTSATMNRRQLTNEPLVLENIIQTFECMISYASSYAVYDETDFEPTEIKYYYQRAKQQSETVIRNYLNDIGVNIRGFRIPAVYGGEDNTRALYKIADKLKRDEDVILDKTIVSFCYVGDVVSALLSDNKGIDGVVSIDAVEVNLLETVTALKSKLHSVSEIIIDPNDDVKDLVRLIL